jgi:hypothetical protein
MPLILFNFPKITLVAYVTETIFDADHLLTVKYRYDATTILDARSLAIQKVLSERKRLNKMSHDDGSLLEHLRVYLEYLESPREQSQTEKLQRHYIYDGGNSHDDNPLHALDFETALWIAAKENAPTIEVETADLTYVVIAQCSAELLALLADTDVKCAVNR